MNGYFTLPVKAKGFYKRLIRWFPPLGGVALQTEPLDVFLYTPHNSVLARLAPEHF